MGYYEGTPCRCGGVRAIIYILGAVFALLLGGILGTMFASFLIENMVLLIAVAAIVLLLLVIAFIVRYCRQDDCGC